MISRWNRFNHYFPAGGPWLLASLGLILALAVGCETPESKKAKRLSTLRIHLETNLDATNRTELAIISQDPLVQFTVEKTPFLNEGYVKEAKVVDVVGGFAIRLEFERRGAWLLEQYTLVNRGRHFAVYCQFVPPGQESLNKGRWLAAPKIIQRITDGVFVFTPQATREEADEIVLGLNHVAKKLDTSSEW